VAPIASFRNSPEMQIWAMRSIGMAPPACRRGDPTRDGRTAMKPRSTTRSANVTAPWVMPGSSCITMTGGPLPRVYTEWV
jgi:hypothetical protein